MKPTSKDRMLVSLIVVVFLLTVCGTGYVIFGKPKVAGAITGSTKMVKIDNLQQIELYKKYITSYAIKVQENNKFYLEYHSYENSVPYESKFDLTADQYKELVEGKDYWFKVKYSKIGDKTYGNIKMIYTENPVRE